MWQAPNSKSHGIAEAKKRQKQRSERSLHVTRVEAELTTTKGTSERSFGTRLLLNDINPEGVALFSSDAVEPGVEVTLTLEEPTKMIVKGTVTACKAHEPDGRIISKHVYSYRLGMRFTFGTDEERQAFETYCRKLLDDFILPQAA